jgi:hypothetical protein
VKDNLLMSFDVKNSFVEQPDVSPRQKKKKIVILSAKK